MRLALFASVTVAAGALCGAACAQQVSVPTNSNAAGKRLQIDLTARALYDSNVARGQAAVAAMRNLKSEETTYTPSGLVNVYMPLGQQLLHASVSGGYDFHQFNKTLDAPRWAATVGGVARLGFCGLNLNGNYGYSQSDLATLPTQVSRNRRETLGAAAQVSCGTNGGLAGFVGARIAETSNSANTAVVDSSTSTFTAGAGYQNRVLGTAQAFVSYTKNSYDKDAVGALVRPDFETYNVGVQVSRPIGARLKGSATLGYQHVKSDDPLIGSSSSLSGSGQLDYRLNSRIGLNLAYDRGASPSTIAGVDYVQLQAITFGARYAVSSRIRTAFNASWDRTDYKGVTSTLPLNFATNSRTRRLGGDVSMTMGRLATVSVNAAQERRTSSNNGFNYTSYQISAQARRSF
jgi:hypothetical protein